VGRRGTAEASSLCSAYARCVRPDENDLDSLSGPEYAIRFASVTGPADQEACPAPHPAFGLTYVSGTAAAANLRTGDLSAVSEVTGAGSVSPLESALANASGDGRLFDLVTIHGPEPTFATQIPLKLHVEGELSGWAGVHATLQADPLGPPPFQSADGCAGTYAQSCSNVVGEAPFSFDLLLNVPVSTANPTFSVFVGLNASAVNAGKADAGSTATLTIELPDGFTFTSASGVLLAPEPSAGALAVAAASCLARGARRPAKRALDPAAR
jgi:hypothetical protein